MKKLIIENELPLNSNSIDLWLAKNRESVEKYSYQYPEGWLEVCGYGAD